MHDYLRFDHSQVGYNGGEWIIGNFRFGCRNNRNIIAEYNVLLSELEKFNPELLDKRRLLAITKSDMLDEQMMEEMLPFGFIDDGFTEDETYIPDIPRTVPSLDEWLAS